MTKKTNYKNLARKQAKLHQDRAHKHRRRRISGWSVAIFLFIGMLVAFVVLLPSSEEKDASKDDTVDSTDASVECSKLEPPPRVTPYPMCLSTSSDYEAVIATSDGPITVQLMGKAAPETVNNFASLAESGFYDGSIFHRIAGSLSVIQAGDGECTFGSPTCGQGGPGYSIPDELSGKEKYTAGVVAMANAGPNSGGSQFFIVTGDKAEGLPPSYTIFGRVIEGMDVAEAIQRTPVEGETPTEEVKIKSVAISPPLRGRDAPVGSSDPVGQT